MEQFTISEHEKKMTLYYYKSNGQIGVYCTGINDMSFFGEQKSDYEQIMEFLVLDKDVYLLENRHKFIIKDKQVQLKEKVLENISKYL